MFLSYRLERAQGEFKEIGNPKKKIFFLLNNAKAHIANKSTFICDEDGLARQT
jgi:hypothetical protein